MLKEKESVFFRAVPPGRLIMLQWTDPCLRAAVIGQTKVACPGSARFCTRWRPRA